MAFKNTVKKFIPKSVFRKIEPVGHLAEAMLITTRNGFPTKGLKVIGVTGTNGKTTTSFMIHKMLVEAGYKTGLMTTVAYGVNNDIHPQVAHMTTVSTALLQKRISEMRQQGIEWLVLEVTSHALAQHRTWGIPFTIAVMTNVTHEHLDYHGTFERYVAAKRMLFEQTERNKNGLQIGIVNFDDQNAETFTSAMSKPVTYGVNGGDLRASDIKSTPKGSKYTVKTKDTTYNITCHIPGSFNVSNSLATVGVGRALGLTQQQIEQGIAALKGVEGRMTKIDEGQDFDVIVDFAHTPDSFEKIFHDLEPVVKGKLIVMFGSAGQRDTVKRAVQGEIAGKYADIVVLTEEDDRDADGAAIIDEISAGAQKKGKVVGKDLFYKHDRTEAIDYTIGIAKKGDTVLLLGKGHEKTIERADGEHPWNEIETAHQAVRNKISKTD